MQTAKKTEDELRHDIRKEFSYSEETDKDKIDSILAIKKDRYTATQAKKKAQEDLQNLQKDLNKEDEPKGKYSLDEIDEISALSGIPKEERAWVVKVAEAEGKKPSEVLDLGYVKTYLKEKAEEKATAQATNTKKGGRSATTPTPETIIAQAKEKGEPETIEDAEALAKAEMDIKIAKSKANRQ